jgi:hypothetical protein
LVRAAYQSLQAIVRGGHELDGTRERTVKPGSGPALLRQRHRFVTDLDLIEDQQSGNPIGGGAPVREPLKVVHYNLTPSAM